MKVEVRLFGTYKEAAKTSILQEELNGVATLGGLLDRLATRYGAAFENLHDANSGVLIIRNADITRELDIKLAEGDVVKLVPAVPGG
ncbi:MAG: MoaD/ThiS family protein [Chloroflexi bacterium]|nr:MoaD/ThiS family protein [Chloroflexota bacterium]